MGSSLSAQAFIETIEIMLAIMETKLLVQIFCFLLSLNRKCILRARIIFNSLHDLNLGLVLMYFLFVVVLFLRR